MTTTIEFKPIAMGDDGLTVDKFNAIGDLVHNSERIGKKLLNFRYYRGRIEIVPQNYVGVIAFRDGSYLEILPKITDLDDEELIPEVKNRFLRMLLSVLEMPFEETGLAHLESWGNNPYEFFISMFLQEISKITRLGIRSKYSDIEGNEQYIRGKIIFSKDITINAFNRERTYQSYQTFNNNCPENRLIKATLRYLRSVSCDRVNIKTIHKLYPYFENCSEISDLDHELKQCVEDRNYKHYTIAIKWCDIFLHNESFTTFNGSNIAYTFLFPMEKLFERYVANTLKKELVDCDVTVQNKEKTLFDEGLTRQIVPDIVIKKNNVTTIIDTKWKCITSNDDISNDDLRQMKEYSADFEGTAILLYPKIGFDEETISTKNKIVVKTKYIDLVNDFDNWWKNIHTCLDED